MINHEELSTPKRGLTQLSDTLDIRHHFEPHEFEWGKSKVVKGKGRPTFHWREEFDGYVDFRTLINYNRDHGLRKKRPEGYKPPKPYTPKGTKKKRGEILNRTIGNMHKRKKKKAAGDADHYPTPPACTQALLDFLQLPTNTKVYEPACGRGHISQTLKLNGFGKVTSTDLYDYGYGHGGIDFLKHAYLDYDWIITNPPFNLAEEFIVRAFKNGKPFAFLLKAIYWNSSRRLPLFNITKPSHILPLTWRPDFSFKRGRSTMDCCWVIWGPSAFLPAPEDLNFKTEFIPLAKPDNSPTMDITGQLLKPFNLLYKD